MFIMAFYLRMCDVFFAMVLITLRGKYSNIIRFIMCTKNLRAPCVHLCLASQNKMGVFLRVLFDVNDQVEEVSLVGQALHRWQVKHVRIM